VYAEGFTVVQLAGFQMIVAFEVFEHLADPVAEAGALFAASPEYVIVGTGRYCGQGRDWEYLFPHHGQHVFLWSRNAHEWLASQHGYEVITCGKTITVYARKQSVTSVKRTLIGACEFGAKITQCLIPLVRRPGVGRDQEALVARVTAVATSSRYD